MIAPSHSRFTLWIGIAAVAALAAGLSVASRQWRPPAAQPPPPPKAAPADTLAPELLAALADSSDDVVARALALAGDSTAIKSLWVDEVKGVDLDSLDATQRTIFLRFANARRCTCGCGYTLAGCRSYDPSCEISLPIVRALFDSVRTGRLRSASGIRPAPRAGG